MNKKIICVRCKKTISGKISIDTKKRKLGKKNITEVDYYCQKCFKSLNAERAYNIFRENKVKNMKAHAKKKGIK